MFFLSITPFILFIFLLVFRKKTLLEVSFFTTLLTSLLLIFFWKVYPTVLLLSFSKGFFVALDIFFIILGALFFLDIVEKHGIIRNIISHLERISPDYRVITIILAWFFEAFLEATAGFGVPCAIVAPILLKMGMSPLQAVIISLLGNSSAVMFGAIGTPTKIGFAAVNHAQIPIFASLYGLVGILIPVFMLWFLVSKEKNRMSQFKDMLPFSILSGAFLVVPMYIFSFFGEEFPSLFGSIAGIILTIILIKSKIAQPKNIQHFHTVKLDKGNVLLDLFPYLLLTFFLIIGKILLGKSSILIPFFNQNFNLFNPGFAFILSSFIVMFFLKDKNLSSLKSSFHKTLNPFFVIIFTSVMVQLMINSGNNDFSIPSIITYISQQFKSTLLPFWAPFIGLFGSFITGSATISNLMFGSFVNEVSNELGFFAPKILGAQLAGAAAGNMIALADMLAAQAVVGLKNAEISIVKSTLLPSLVYVFLIGIFCFLF